MASAERRSVSLDWVPRKYGLKQGKYKSMAIAGWVLTHCFGYAKKTSKQDFLFCDYFLVQRYCSVCIFQ